MSKKNDSDSSNSESEVSPCSSNFDPLKVLYSPRVKVPVKNAPVFNTIVQYEASLSHQHIAALGESSKVKQIEEEKARKKLEEERRLLEKNKQRFAKFEAPTVPARGKKIKNVVTRMETLVGPLRILKECVDQKLRIKVITRHGHGIRGELHATLVAFDKQWNLALSDVLEVWKRKGVGKRKIPSGLTTSVPKGSAAKISPVPTVTETPCGKGVWECTRHLPQVLVRGEHVVLINIVER